MNSATVSFAELLRQPDEPRQVVLARDLALAELVGNRLEQPLLERDPAHLARPAPPEPRKRLQQLPRAVAGEERSALERDLGLGQRLLEVGRARVRPEEQRHLLVRRAVLVQLAHPLDDERRLVLGLAERARHRLGSRRAASPAAPSPRRRAAARAGSRTRAPRASSGSSPRAGRRSRPGTAAASRAGARGSRR